MNLQWLGPVVINARNAWASRTEHRSFMIFEEPGGGFTASSMLLKAIDLGDRKVVVNEDGSITAPLRDAADIERDPGKPVMLGGGPDGVVFDSLEAAQASCLAYARGS